MAVEIFIARHGQDEDNANGILNGRRNRPLTELGREQAVELAKGIAAMNIIFDTVYSSPLGRAHETANIVSKELGIQKDPLVIPDLIERDLGIMSGLPFSEIEPRCAPDIIQAGPVSYFLHPEGAETFPALVERGKKVLDYIRSLQSEGNVLLVCHGDIGKMLYAAASGRDWQDVLREFHFGNGDLIEVSPDGFTHKIKLPQHNL